MTAIRWRPKFSLRMLLAATAAVAVGIGTLLNASPLLVAAAATISFALYGAAAIGAVYRRGSAGAFAGGFFLAGAGYLLLVNGILRDTQRSRPLLLTRRALDSSHGLVVRTILNPYYPRLTGGGNMPGAGGGMPSGGEGGASMPGGAVGMGGGGGALMIQWPPIEEFRELGQYYWSLLFGLLGGMLARRFHVLRSGEREGTSRGDAA